MMADPMRNRDPVAPDPLNPADPADPRYNDPATGVRGSDNVTVNNSGRRGSSNMLMIGVIAAAIVIALLVFMNWTPGTQTTPGATAIDEPAATAPAPAGDTTTAPAPAAEAPADAAPAAPATGDTAPAPAGTAPADTAPVAPAE